MSQAEDTITRLQAAVAETEARVGKDSPELSHRLDELAAALKAEGRLLDAANASARARTIRTTAIAKDEDIHREKFGDVDSSSTQLSATAWLKKLHHLAICGSGVILLVSFFLPAGITKDLIGSAMAATFLQLLLYPVKSLPRPLKYAVVAVGSGIIWAVLGGGG